MVCSTQDKVVIPRKKIIERRNFYTSSPDRKANKQTDERNHSFHREERIGSYTKSWHNDSLFFNSKSLTLKGIFLSYFVKTVFSVFLSDYTIFLTGIKKIKFSFKISKINVKILLKKNQPIIQGFLKSWIQKYSEQTISHFTQRGVDIRQTPHDRLFALVSTYSEKMLSGKTSSYLQLKLAAILRGGER